MESSKAVIGALLFIVLVIGANFIMYGIARGWAKPGKKDFLETLGQSFTAAQQKENSMDELHRKMEELEKGKKKDAGESE